MDEQVDEQIKNDRSAKLLAITKKQSDDYLNSQIGKELEVLIEEETQVDDVKYFVGHSKEYVKTLIKSEDNLENRIVSCIGTKRFGQNMILAEMKR